MKNYIFIFITVLLLVSCKIQKHNNHISLSTTNNKLISEKFDHWHFKNYKEDSVPGISLNKLYKALPKNIKPQKITIAIIDTDLDINHYDLQGVIWKNKNEIVNNIDDDSNGYVDDVYGWNFLRNSKGERLLYSSYSSIRTYQKLNPIFEGKSIEEVIDTVGFKNYLKAIKDIESNKKSIKKNYDYVKFLKEGYPKAQKAMDSLFKKEKYTLKEIDSVYYVYEKINKPLAANAAFLYDYRNDKLEGYADILLRDTQNRENLSNNINFYDRKFIGDDVNDIDDTNYGNSKINGDLDVLKHGSIVSGVLAANRNNNIGVKGITNNIKIMTLSVAARKGVANDKDLALAIRYAVDNGAKIINYCSTKYIPTNKYFLEEALKYAEKNKVLFITSSGNNYKNLDSENFYPNDNYKDTKLKNIINVSAIGKKVNKNFKPRSANFGKNSVDLFAPGRKIPTILPNNKYKLDSGTSMAAPMVTGVAALILSYYPNLTVFEIKDLIFKTVDKYDVEVRYQYKPALYMNFSKMSRTGGVLNAYKAFMQAGELSQSKK